MRIRTILGFTIPLIGIVLAMIAGTGRLHALADEVQFVAVEAGDGLSSQLFLIKQGPLQRISVATRNGKTAHLVVCDGLAYWAVNETARTVLYRSRMGESDVVQLATYPGTSHQLATDGNVVFWSVFTSTGGSIYYASNRLSSAQYVDGMSGAPKDLVVKNQTAFWAFEASSPGTPTAFVRRYQLGAASESVLINPNSRINGIASDGQHVWTLVTRQGVTPSQVHLYQLPIETPTGTASSIWNTTGTGGQIKANPGCVVWTFDTPTGSARLMTRAFDGTPVSFSPPGNFVSRGLELTSDHGVWWQTSGDSLTRIHSFDLFRDSILSATEIPAMTVTNSSRWGDAIWLALRSADGNQNQLMSFEPTGSGFRPGSVIPRNAVVSALAAGQWHLLDVAGGGLTSRDSAAAVEEFGVPISPNAQIASGPAGLPFLPFAANTGPGTRRLFGYTGGIRNFETPGLGTGGAFYPEDFRVWNDQLWMSVKDTGTRVAAFASAAGSEINAIPGHQNPEEFRAFKGRLLFEDDAEPGANGAVGRRNVFRDRSGTIGIVGNPSLPAPSRLLGEALGFAIFESSSGNPGLTAVSLSEADISISLPSSPAASPDVRDLLGWKGRLLGHYRTETGDRCLFRASLPQGDSAPILTAAEFHSFTTHRGQLYFVAKSGSAEWILTLAAPDGPLITVLDASAAGLTNVRGLHSHGGTLYAMGESVSGPVLIRIQNAVAETSLNGLKDFQSFRSFQGSLYAITGGPDSNLFRWDDNAWATFPGQSFPNSADFFEHSGSLFFSAGYDGDRRLVRLTRRSAANVSGAYSDFNPRSLAGFGDTLILAGNTSGGRELFAFADHFFGWKLQQVSSIGNEPQSANPFLAGPEDILLTSSRLTSHLPTGFLVGTLSVESANTPIRYAILTQYGNTELLLAESSLSLARPTSVAFGPNLSFTIEATDSLGISSVASFSLEVTNNEDEWRNEHFTGSEISDGLAADRADPDGDHVVNLMERALGTDPREGADPTNPQSLVQSSIKEASGGEGSRFLSLAFRTPLAFPAGVRYLVQASDDLSTWNTLGVLIAEPDGEVRWLGDPTAFKADWNLLERRRDFEFRDSSDLRSTPRRFLRLRVER